VKRFALCLLAVCGCAAAQTQHVAAAAEPATAAPGAVALARVTAQIEPGWHIYSISSPGGIPAQFQVGGAVELARTLQPAPKKSFDSNLGSNVETYEGQVAFLLELRVKKDAPAGPAEIPVSLKYQACDASQCNPGKWSGTLALNIDPAARAATPAIPAGYAEAKPPSAGSNPSAATAAQQGWAAFLLVAFGFGLASIFTPCVFPMIPITMSYFLKKEGSASQAAVFCLGIVVLFSGIGLAITAALGPFGIVTLGQNAWVNGFIAALFIAFGLSLLGAFEITVPSSILTRLNQSSEKGGFAGTLLMGLTFSLASFACVGPFVGTLLAASVSEGAVRPLIGMVTFATGLALPFFLLALFPQYLKRMPKSGGWLARVKVVMGFVILAASLKYLSSLDQVAQWNFLTRDRFLAIWIVLFAMAGLYLLGFLRLEGVKPDDRMGLGRLFAGMAFLAFAISLVPGMFGGKLGDLDAYVPLASGEGASSSAQPAGLVWMKDQYREALDRARREGKLVFVNFTGYACANCHWMKANMFTRPEIAAEMQKFVLVELYGDGGPSAEANQQLELTKFHTVAEPYYAILDPDEKVIATFDRRTTDAAEYLAFLKKGDSAAPTGAPAVASAASTPFGSAPQFSKLGGGSVDLTGKVAVVNFWATYCVPCIQEIPSFNKLNREQGAKGVVVVGVAMDDDPSIVPAFLKKHPMDYAVALGSEALTQQYKLDALPVTVVFDRSGRQVKRFDGFLHEDELKAAVAQASGSL
jgi:thiol:disulfide interchange protein DsbD